MKVRQSLKVTQERFEFDEAEVYTLLTKINHFYCKLPIPSVT